MMLGPPDAGWLNLDACARVTLEEKSYLKTARVLVQADVSLVGSIHVPNADS